VVASSALDFDRSRAANRAALSSLLSSRARSIMRGALLKSVHVASITGRKEISLQI
jgi:hypothetical protein